MICGCHAVALYQHDTGTVAVAQQAPLQPWLSLVHELLQSITVAHGRT
jgi:hypothetical protein